MSDEWNNELEKETDEESAEQPDEETSEQTDFSDEAPFAEKDPFDREVSGFEEPLIPPVRYTPVEPVKDYRPMNRGLSVFAIILSAVILLTGSCLAGYYTGKRSTKTTVGQKVEVHLAKRPTEKDALTPSKVYDKVNVSVVGIRSYNTSGQVSDASGVIYSKDGYIVTNDHIYKDIASPKFKVYLYDGTECDASYVAGDNVSDLAVLKIKTSVSLTPATFGNSDDVVCGEDVAAVGRLEAQNPSSITCGIISMTRRRVSGSATNYSSSMIQTDSAINPGSSGGALSNFYGQVIGITASKLEGTEYDRIGFAIPTVTVKRVVEQLIEKGKVSDRARLGITYTEINSVVAEINNTPETGLYISSVSNDSDLYGKVEQGDIITHINGTKIQNADTVLDIIENAKAGDAVTLTILLQKGGSLDYDVKLGANVGQSSYSDLKPEQTESESQSQQSDFNFPAGE